MRFPYGSTKRLILAILLFLVLPGAFLIYAQEPQQPMTDQQLADFKNQAQLNVCSAEAEQYRRLVLKLTKENTELKKKLTESTQ